MNKNKKGFTLVELLSVLILLIVIIVIAVFNFMPIFDETRKRTLVDEAYVMSEGALNKYSDDRLAKTYSADVFASKNSTKRCYSVKSLIGRYVNKEDKNYRGSVEICTDSVCTYRTKLWLSDGESYINGVIVDDNLSVDDVDDAPLTDYFDSCGINISNSVDSWYFDYIGYEQAFVAPEDGDYALMAWGAQGGNRGGKGGYAYAEVSLKEGEVLYINVGGAGGGRTYDPFDMVEGGYNGGGKANYNSGGGGGATSIALKTGLISGISAKDILIVAAGGGGGWDSGNNGYNGGGRCDSSGTACFGSGTYGRVEGIGAGGGLYTTNGVSPNYITNVGGRINIGTPSGCSRCGGSGYIGNSRDKNGVMYMYGGSSNDSASTKTVATSKYSIYPTLNFAKLGDGYAIISRVGTDVLEPGYDYTGSEQTFTVEQTGTYKLEVWGAQGGGGNPVSTESSRAGLGGYAVGEINLTAGQTLYIHVGGAGSTGGLAPGGYNGGGISGAGDFGPPGSGGGATHIATSPGLLSQLNNDQSSVLIVAGGGGGSDNSGGGEMNTTDDGTGGNGGGYIASYSYLDGKFYTDLPRATQTTGYQFGKGQNATTAGDCGGGGGGWYGGFAATNCNGGGGGGSGYIGNPNLFNKAMYCDDCATSLVESTKTYQAKCVDMSAVSECAKVGNGYARITKID